MNYGITILFGVVERLHDKYFNLALRLNLW